MTDPLMNIEEYERILANPREFIETFCYITTKEGKFEKLKLNYPQDKMMKIVEEKLSIGEPVRIRVLKARQMGFSTLISALGFWWSAMNENSAYGVVAHKESSASSIFNKNKIFYDNLPSKLKPQVDKFNSEQISFNTKSGRGLRSKIFFGTAGGGELFRGETILFLHKSEIAFWDDKEGVKRYTSEIVGQNMTMLGKKSDGEGSGYVAPPAQSSANSPQESAPIGEGTEPDDLPF